MTPNSTMQNLDIRCAELGRELASIHNMDEKTLNAALTVLEEQGPYAMLLYVQARHSSIAEDFKRQCANFLETVFGSVGSNTNEALDLIQSLAEDLDDLLFARDLLRNALAYARYHLKARSPSSGG